MLRPWFVALFLLGTMCRGTPSLSEKDQDSDEILLNLLVDYYNVLEKHKQHQLDHNMKENLPQQSQIPFGEDLEITEASGEGKEHEEIPEKAFDSITDSLTDNVLDYVREHLKTRIWSRLSGTFDDTEELPRAFPEIPSTRLPESRDQIPDKRVHDYTNTHLWWEHEDLGDLGNTGRNTVRGDGVRYGQEGSPTRRMVNRVFTASGFALSFVVMVVFFFACTYCWCISSPSKMLGTLSTILAIVLLLHRLHEFFMVFSLEDMKNVGDAFLGTTASG